MATLVATTLAVSGTVEPTPAAAAGGGDQVLWGTNVRLKIINGGVGSINVTIAAQVACDQGSTHNIVNAIGAGVTEFMGPFTERYKDANGYIQITYSGVTSVTIYAFQ